MVVWTVILPAEDPEGAGSREFRIVFRIVSAKSVTPGEAVDDVGEEEGEDCCAKERA